MSEGLEVLIVLVPPGVGMDSWTSPEIHSGGRVIFGSTFCSRSRKKRANHRWLPAVMTVLR